MQALKNLFKDSVVYGLANSIQKLAPALILPIVTGYLGKEALKLYDISFIYAYLFCSLILLSLDSAASVYFFEKKEDAFDKRQVLGHAFILQVVSIGISFLFLFSYYRQIAGYIFAGDDNLGSFWSLALWVIPGYMMQNYGLYVLLWHRRKAAYLFVCLLNTLLCIVVAYVAVIYFGGGLRELFYTQIGAVTVSGVIAILLNGRKIIGGIFPLNLVLVQKLLWFGFPFAVTSFFRQVIPAIDRFFLLYFNFDDELPYYILAVKIASFFTIATNAFTLAFMPYSLNKLNEKDAEVEISNMFRLISVLAFATIPFIMLFRNQLILLFADASYLEAAKLLPILFFGWVFDLFGYFSMLGIYKSRNSLLLLVLLLVGTGCISLLNIMLVPLWGIYGAAISFTFTKLFLFVFTILVLKKHFRLHIYLRYFLPSFVIAVLFCFFIFYINTYLYLLLLLIVFICLVFLFRKYLSADNIHKMFTSK